MGFPSYVLAPPSPFHVHPHDLVVKHGKKRPSIKCWITWTCSIIFSPISRIITGTFTSRLFFMSLHQLQVWPEKLNIQVVHPFILLYSIIPLMNAWMNYLVVKGHGHFQISSNLMLPLTIYIYMFSCKTLSQHFLGQGFPNSFSFRPPHSQHYKICKNNNHPLKCIFLLLINIQ